ncbi:MAG: serine/threonine-protein phosphatase [Erysipelotrichaceae bacterium]|nr:serine/threonine-protein phosphatase [Erysipelotrichaceae bacterium]
MAIPESIRKKARFLMDMALILLVINAFVCIYIALQCFNSPHVTPAAMYNAGVDVMGAFVCPVLFYGCMGDRKEKLEDSTRWFLHLIILTAISFLFNVNEWYAMGNPAYISQLQIAGSITKIIDFLLTYCFYRYVRETLEFEGRLARWLDRAIVILLGIAVALMLINIFHPLFITVTADGQFEYLPFFWTVDLYMAVVAPLTVILLYRCKATRRQKIVSMSFILIPIVHYLLTGRAYAYATQYGSVLLALVLIYSVVYSDRTKQLSATRSELETANQIQEAMLPNIFPAFPGRSEFDVYASMDPAKEVGGDFYDFFLIDDDHLCLVMADVSGKGIPAALFMMASKIILQSCAMLGSSAGDILTRTNEAICSNNEQQMFVTVWLGILEISTGKLTAANAGHEFPFLKRANGDFEVLRDKHGFVIGGLEDATYKEYELQLEPGDKLFVYTDGVTEATNKSSELFGMERLGAALNACSGENPEGILRHVHQCVDDFVKEAPQFDDLTMLCFEYKGNAKAE